MERSVPQEALEHGYRPLTAGKKKCENCRFSSGVSEEVYCRMFKFWALARGVCDEWSPDSGRET